jgi:hypothetical protein
MSRRTTFGPEWVAAAAMRPPPGRSRPRCPLCPDPVDLSVWHAVVMERFDGRVTAGRFAHLACAKRRWASPVQEESDGA